MESLYQEAADELRRDPLYVDPTARDELDEQGVTFDEDAVREVLEDADTPIRVAIFPESAAGGSAVELAQATQEHGSYLVILSDGERRSTANDMGFREGALDQAADTARGSADGDLQAWITEFVNRVEDLAAGGTGAATDDSGAAGGNGGVGGALPLAVLVLAGTGGFLYYRRNKRQRERAELDQVRPALEEDITAFGEELTNLDLDVRTASIPAESQNDYARALDLYEDAKSAAERVEAPGHIRPVTAALEEGRWLLTRVQARLNGETPPDRRQPCFFDPRHGPSVEDIEWAPPGGIARQVPACAADATRIRDGDDPDSRLVTVNGERRPYWEAGPAYSAWAGGYYGGVLPTMLIGTMLGSSIAHTSYGAGGDVGAGGFDGGGFDGGGFDGGGFDGGGFDFGGF